MASVPSWRRLRRERIEIPLPTRERRAAQLGGLLDWEGCSTLSNGPGMRSLEALEQPLQSGSYILGLLESVEQPPQSGSQILGLLESVEQPS